MHKKILISDDKSIFLGSANFTTTSLRMHDNLVVGLYHKELAQFIQHSLEHSFFFQIENQPAEFWNLPDHQNRCLKRLLGTIDQSSSSIYAALFTFTHPKILEALIRAKQRGVSVEVAIDFYSSQGASKAAIETLEKAGISLIIGTGGKLLHHKWAVIDESTLFLGSANWTESAFRHNEDCVFVLENLSLNQKKYFKKIWKEIKRNSLH